MTAGRLATCFLYTYDKVVAPNVSLPQSLRKEGELSPDMLGALLKRHYSETHRTAQDPHPEPHTTGLCATATLAERETRLTQIRWGQHQSPASAESPTLSMLGKETCCEHSPRRHMGASSQRCPVSHTRREARTVAMEMGREEDAHAAGGWEDDKDRMVLEIVQMYSRQQERLHSTLQKQMQLEMELEALRGGEAVRLRELSAEHCELQSELEAVHTEHAQRLGEVRQEQRDLERRLEQLRQQSCACEPSTHRDQEARYAAQLSELRRRLDRAEADREELQEELCREREAREKLELIISQLKQQMYESSAAAPATTAGSASPSPAPTQEAPPPAEDSPAKEQRGLRSAGTQPQADSD
ncbi:hypothetical protein JZ751_009056 [Albula glossodonta]|uniref:Uncharacterized protein n=1 Tax=Albula glossodonta TaxID=121402 RepID=A0A8T2N234_9TELE|nr:hypothetical protein JZ751_009056 [Albula glossodonta]